MFSLDNYKQRSVQWKYTVLVYPAHIDKEELLESLYRKILDKPDKKGTITVGYGASTTHVVVCVDPILKVSEKGLAFKSWIPKALPIGGRGTNGEELYKRALDELKEEDPSWLDSTTGSRGSEPSIELRPWQRELVEELANNELDTYKVTWYNDTEGSSGKHFVCKYLTKYRNHVHYLTYRVSEPVKDVCIGDDVRIVMIRVANETTQQLYDLIDNISRGDGHPECKVVVLANCPPRVSAFSRRRWDIRLVNTRDTTSFVQLLPTSR
jgi:hypothetical protein